jgi:hypothetical protein
MAQGPDGLGQHDLLAVDLDTGLGQLVGNDAGGDGAVELVAPPTRTSMVMGVAASLSARLWAAEARASRLACSFLRSFSNRRRLASEASMASP